MECFVLIRKDKWSHGLPLPPPSHAWGTTLHHDGGALHPQLCVYCVGVGVCVCVCVCVVQCIIMVIRVSSFMVLVFELELIQFFVSANIVPAVGIPISQVRWQLHYYHYYYC